MAEQNDWGAHLSTVGAFIREQRRLVKLSQRQLANATGLSDTYLSQLERGLHEPSLRALRAIAKGLNVSAEQLISLTGAIEEELQPDGAADGPGDGDGVPTGTAPVTSEAAIRQDPRLSEAQKTALLAVLGSYLAANDGGDAAGGAQSSGRTGSRSGRSSSARKSPTTRAV